LPEAGESREEDHSSLSAPCRQLLNFRPSEKHWLALLYRWRPQPEDLFVHLLTPLARRAENLFERSKGDLSLAGCRLRNCRHPVFDFADPNLRQS
jgi:hypothetical protein